MSIAKLELRRRYQIILQEIEVEKKRIKLEQLHQIDLQKRREEEARVRIRNGTGSVLDHYIFCIKLDSLFISDNHILESLIKNARCLAIEIFGEDSKFNDLKIFLTRLIKKIKRLLKYLIKLTFRPSDGFDDKRKLITQFRKLLIKSNYDDTENSLTPIKSLINRVLNFQLYNSGNNTRNKKSYIRSFVM
ncbi:hypothetical protein [uncultured Sphingobacterium sp.]|uniref:hypothetical protein n=1 Tax=uncultured Sphingobacterium sp. TaxID=182688 RepID=UPI00374A8A0D